MCSHPPQINNLLSDLKCRIPLSFPFVLVRARVLKKLKYGDNSPGKKHCSAAYSLFPQCADFNC
jgi:hypothetical protein